MYGFGESAGQRNYLNDYSGHGTALRCSHINDLQPDSFPAIIRSVSSLCSTDMLASNLYLSVGNHFNINGDTIMTFSLQRIGLVVWAKSVMIVFVVSQTAEEHQQPEYNGYLHRKTALRRFPVI